MLFRYTNEAERRVTDRTRTGNTGDHNPVLRHLSYGHQRVRGHDAPARDRTWTSGFANLRGFHFHHGDARCLRQDSNLERGVRSAA